MKKNLIVVAIVFSMLIFGSLLSSAQNIRNKYNYNLSERDKSWFKENPNALPIWLTQDELQRVDEIGQGFIGTSPPPGPVRQPAEFEPMEGVLIEYNTISGFGISYQIIKEMAEDVEVVTIVASTSEQNYVTSQYQSHGVNLDNCVFLIAPSDSIWTRDYGPWFIFNGDDEQGIVDMIYNRPRPNDDQIPTRFGNWRSIPVYAMSLETAGGNYMTDGQGISISTDLVWEENPGITHAQIDQMLNDYCGIDTYHVVPDALGDYIKHIDCWAKLLSPDTIMIIEPSTSHPHYEDFEEAVDYFESQACCYGTPYNIVRVYTHNSEPYINSLILNNKVLVPITGSQWDDEAIVSYQSALPGYEVLGFTGSWQSTDALHCRTMGITDSGMLYIEHTPIYETQSGHEGYEIDAEIFAYSGKDLIEESTGVYYSLDQETWTFVEMQHVVNDQYKASIPAQPTGSTVYYYIHAEDESGRLENHPYIGEDMAYSFETILVNEPPEILNISGETNGKPKTSYEYCITINDPELDDMYIIWDWGDGENTSWLGPYDYQEEYCESHAWDESGTYTITVKIKDIFDAESSEISLEVNMKKFRPRIFDILFDSSFLFKLLSLFFLK